MPLVKFYPSPVQADFILSDSFENLIEGPRGEGKTEAGIIAIAYHAQVQKNLGYPTPQPWALVRDTFSNLERTTLKSLQACQLASSLDFTKGGRHIKEKSGLFELLLFGMDDMADLNTWLSLQLAGIWFEECAPAMASDIGGGIQEDAWSMAITSMRFPCKKPRAQISQNPPDEDHWTQPRFKGDPVEDSRFFHLAKGENQYLPNGYRERTAAALSNRPDLKRRLVDGIPGFVQQGEAVTPDYNDNLHRSKYDLAPLPIPQAIRFWDGWHNPTCIIAQRTPRGRILILDTIRGENMGVRQLINNQIKPLIQERYRHITKWRDLGDETMYTPDQSDRTVTAAGTVNQLLGASFEPCKNKWEPRRESCRNILTAMIDGEPMVEISRHEKILHQALRGGWHYKKVGSSVVRDKPVKNLHSHPGDAFSYGAVKLMPWEPAKQIPIAVRMNARKRAKSYAVR